MTDPARANIPAHAPALPPQLEARIAVVESAAPASDFDASSWFWMILLGVAIPLILLAVGWWA
jgi:hypothetical protein